MSEAAALRVHSAYPDSQEDRLLDHRFRVMADTAPVLLWTARQDSLCTFFNSTWLDFTGRTLEEEWGVGWAEGLHPEDFQPAMDHYVTSFNKRDSFEMIYRLRRKDGQYRWILDRGVPYFQNKVFLGYIGSCVDITEIRESQEALLRSRDSLQSALQSFLEEKSKFEIAIEAAPSGMVMIDQEGTIVLVNRKMEELFGYSRQELEGHKIEMLIPMLKREENEVFRTRQTSRELMGVRKDGSLTPVEVGLTPVRTPRGAFVISSVVDIAQRRKTEESLRSLARDLQRSNSELENFAYLASHDLQAPLRSIASFSQLIRENMDFSKTPELEEYFGIVEKAAREMKQLIDALLSYSRLGNGSERHHGPVDLNQILQGALQIEFAETKEFNVTSDLLPVVAGDATLLKRLLVNLLSNAHRFRKPGQPSHVHISATENEGFWWVAVRDDSIGIEKENLTRVFTIFARCHSNADIPGTGIGLAMCKKIVQIHGGKIWVESVPGRGSVFYFTLPRVSA